jgi:hypothetical protein
MNFSFFCVEHACTEGFMVYWFNFIVVDLAKQTED